MLTAVKENREARINDDQKDEYLKDGYDVIDEKGQRTIAPSKKVSYAEYEKLKKENDKLKKASNPKIVDENKELKTQLDALQKELKELKKAGE